MMTLRETYKGNSQTKFKTSMLKSGLFGYSDPYILVKGTIESSTQEQEQSQTIEKIK